MEKVTKRKRINFELNWLSEMTIDIEIDVMTFENCEKAYEIDRSDIPYSYVEDVPTLIRTMEYGAENNLIGHAFLVRTDNKPIATIMIGEGIVGEANPTELQDRPFYRLMFFVVDKRYRNLGLGTQILEAAIDRIYVKYGERPILLEVQQENENAARFYERNGFKRTSYRIEDDYYFVRGL